MMKKIYKKEDSIYRVLAVEGSKSLVIDCIKASMPKWIEETFESFEEVSEDDFKAYIGICFENMENLSPKAKKTMYERYTLISGALAFVTDENMRSMVIDKLSKENEISKKTIRRYLCSYLVFQDIRALAPVEKKVKEELSKDEKNMRWALNKYFYNKNKNSLKHSYTMMLKEKYCDKNGKLIEEYPSFYQFRYFYRKTKKLETYYISRDGIKDYQKNNRPLLGDGIQEFAPMIGTAMLDATICDIYLINEKNQLIGRPILTAAIDSFSGLCLGYSLTWEGGMYSLRNLMLNVISDKREHCKKFGIEINDSEWNCSQMPLKLVTDKGAEYRGQNFENLIDLGVNIVNLPSFRPELKGAVEKFFDVIQEYYKPYLKGRGVIENDYRERGAHDYRKDASLTMEQFEAVIIHCILFYNAKRIIENFPYTEEMLEMEIKPYSSEIWNYGLDKVELITVNERELMLTLLPRVSGRFTRQGLRVNGLRYHNDNFKEEYLQGKEALIAFNPDDVSNVFLIENGKYIEFSLIESRFQGKSLSDVTALKEIQTEMVKKEKENRLQGEIDLSKHILAIREQSSRILSPDIKNIRANRKNEQYRVHVSSI